MQNRVLGLLGLATKAGDTIVGTDASIDYINSKKAKLVLIAEDSQEKNIENFKFLCEKNKVPIIVYEMAENLSKAVGRANIKVLCIKNTSLSKEIQKIINGGEVNG